MRITRKQTYADGLVKRGIYELRLAKSIAQEIIKTIDKTNDALTGYILRHQHLERLSQSGNVGKLGAELKKVEQEIKDLRIAGFDKAEQKLLQHCSAIIKADAEWLAKTAKKVVGKNKSLVMPTEKQLQNIINDKIAGKSLKSWFAKLRRDDAKNLTAALRNGLLRVENYSDITKSIIGTAGKFRRDGKTQITRNRAATMVNTAIMAMVNSVRKLMAENNPDAIGYVRYTAVLDDRTSIMCAGLDGRIFRYDNAPVPGRDTHPNCRSILIPTTDGNAKIPRRVSGSNKTTRMNYGDWLRRQSKSFQVRVLGKSRAEQFRNGSMDLSDFVDYGNRRVYTLAELHEQDLYE